jgi:hypothetical protein
MSYSENFKTLFDTYYTRLQEDNYISLPVMKFNGVKIRIKIYGVMMLKDNQSKYSKRYNSIPLDTYISKPSHDERYVGLNSCVYQLKIRGEMVENEIHKCGIPLYDYDDYDYVYENIKELDIDIPFKQVTRLSKLDIFNRIPKIKSFIFETLDDLAVELPTLEFDNFHFKLYSTNPDDDIQKKLSYEKEHFMFWKKIKEPDYECSCCICSVDSKFKTECGHTLCLECHFKLKIDGEDTDEDEVEKRKCPMCRNEYIIINWEYDN